MSEPKKLRTLVLDVYKDEVREAVLPDTLEAFYEALDCHFIEIVVRWIGGRPYSVMCDEEGTFRSDLAISAVSNAGEMMLVGNLAFFGPEADEDGNLVELSQEDVSHIRRYIGRAVSHSRPQGHPLLTCCEYWPEA